jgi:MFS family permease
VKRGPHTGSRIVLREAVMRAWPELALAGLPARPQVTFLTGLAGFAGVSAIGGAVGLLLGGALTEYLSWRWTLYVNLIFAAVAFAGGALLLTRQPSPVKPRLDIPGVLLVSGAVFCLVYGFSNAAAHSWHAPSTWGSWPPARRLSCCSRYGRAGRPTRCCRPAWCSTATGAAPTPRCSSPRPGCSGSSCS